MRSFYILPNLILFAFNFVGGSGDCDVSCFCTDDQNKQCVGGSGGQTLGAGAAAGAAAGAGAAAVAAANQNKPQGAAPNNKNRQPQQQNHRSPPTGAPKCNWCLRPSCNPGGCTGKTDGFDAKADAQRLWNAVKGLGTDEDALIDVLTHRSDEQIEMIRQEYQGLGGGVDHDVGDDTSRKLKDLLLALMQPRDEFFADEMKNAIDEGDEGAMTQILTSLSPCAIRQIGSAFSRKYDDQDLITEVKKKEYFKYKNFLVELIKANRDDDSKPIDEEKARKDAQKLFEGGPNSWFLKDKDSYIEIFTKSSYSHLRKVEEIYNSKGRNLLEDLKDKSVGGGKLQDGLIALLKNTHDQPGYFASEIKDNMGSTFLIKKVKDTPELIRIIRGRCGIDLGDIKAAYEKMYNKKLIDEVNEHNYGDYNKALLKLLSQ